MTAIATKVEGNIANPKPDVFTGHHRDMTDKELAEAYFDIVPMDLRKVKDEQVREKLEAKFSAYIERSVRIARDLKNAGRYSQVDFLRGVLRGERSVTQLSPALCFLLGATESEEFGLKVFQKLQFTLEEAEKLYPLAEQECFKGR